MTTTSHLEYLPTYDEVFYNYLSKNQPFMICSKVTKKWRSRQEWVTEDGQPDFKFLDKHFGSCQVPVADCQKCEYSAQPKQTWKFSEYVEYLQKYHAEGHNTDLSCLYLKDWHFNRDFPDYPAYTTPVYFASDWLNEFWDHRDDKDDYRFVYIGVKGSWTPFHHDVFLSYSWSANICGSKKWLIFPAGEEAKLRDASGNLPYDVTTSTLIQPISVTQGPGEIIFIPSGWHHQVHNLEDTISINHNWLNACNVHLCWEFLQKSLLEVQHELMDLKDDPEWNFLCQKVLKSNSGIDYREFYVFMRTIAANRITSLSNLHTPQHAQNTGKMERLKHCNFCENSSFNTKSGKCCDVHELNKLIKENPHLKLDENLEVRQLSKLKLGEHEKYQKPMESSKLHTNLTDHFTVPTTALNVTLENPELHTNLASETCTPTTAGNIPTADESLKNYIPEQEKTAKSEVENQNKYFPHSSELTPSHPCHLMYDLYTIVQVVCRMLDVIEFIAIDLSDLESQPSELVQEIIDMILNIV